MRPIILLVPLLAFLALACDGDGDGQQAATATPQQGLATATPPQAAQAQLAYADSDGNVWLVGSDGSDRTQLAEGSCSGEVILSWSPTGDRVACSNFSDNTLVVVDTEGQVLIEVESARGVVWSPAGQHMAYILLDEESLAPQATVLADADGNVVDELDGVIGVVWSPDGSSVAYLVDSGQVVTHNVATGEQQSVDVDVDGVLAWVIGGDALLVSTNQQVGDLLTTYDGNLVDLATGQLSPIPELNSQSASLDRGLWLLPDQSKVVVLRREGGDIGILDLATLRVAVIEGSVVSYPSEGIPFMHIVFSQDGSQIAWADVSGAPEATIYRARSDGTERVELATLAAGSVAFSPDLTRVAYIVPVDGGPETTLWTANIDGSEAVEIGPGASPVWRPRP